MGEAMMKVTHVTLSVELVNQVLSYLATKPFNEVFEMIGAIKTQSDASLQEQVGKSGGEKS